MNKEIKNFLTFDLENWYDSGFVKNKKGKDFVVQGLNKVLKLLDKHKVKATFFVTGPVIKKYPKEIKNLSELGHEIASHSYDHIMLNKMSDEEIKENIIKSKQIIKKTINKNPKGFRAPSWSLTRDRFWVYDFLYKNGFKYSSSLFPVNMLAYGSFSFPTSPFSPLKNKEFTELPVRPFKLLNLRIPFSGGVYFRIVPRRIVSFCIRRLNKKGKPAIIYIHPWELCEDLPRVKTSLIGKIVGYWNIKKTESKLDYILNNFKFDSIDNIMKSHKRL